MLVLSAAGEKAKPDSGEKNRDARMWVTLSTRLLGTKQPPALRKGVWRGCGRGGDEKTKQPCDLSYLYLESHRMSQIYSEG